MSAQGADYFGSNQGLNKPNWKAEQARSVTSNTLRFFAQAHDQCYKVIL